MLQQFAKITDEGTLSTTAIDPRREKLMARVIKDGFLPLEIESDEIDEDSLGDTDGVEWQHLLEADRIRYRRVVVSNSPSKIESEIKRIKGELTESDYLVVKSMESSLAGVDCGYDVESLHQDREALRSRIRELEALLTPQE